MLKIDKETRKNKLRKNWPLLAILVIILISLIIVLIVEIQRNNRESLLTPNQPNYNVLEEIIQAEKEGVIEKEYYPTFSNSQIAEHDTLETCWIVLRDTDGDDSEVYDISNWQIETKADIQTVCGLKASAHDFFEKHDLEKPAFKYFIGFRYIPHKVKLTLPSQDNSE
ncbi:MAG: hypothetical protein OXF49_00620 [Candidatus Saccharibacteria bacterium]|nr:hypothetical protein [Candidatus Saccharibacteria bacterium]MCY4088624.1 hypothetical protein [Candidatus Saccharibacteria bacterium]